MRIIYVTPHLSTGGMPEYLRRKVELLKEDHDVWVVEKHFETAYRTIRDKIESLIGDRLVNIGENHERLLQLIDQVKPDVVHFEELSDYHFKEALLDVVYRKDREYLIFDTLHDSSIDHREKRYIPDKMLVVSPWQVNNFMELGIPVEMLEHEIIPGNRDRSGLYALGLDPNKKHVVQVGLFSRRKNQGETISIARLMPDVCFHFVGNQPDNYRHYWEPLMKDLPSNCKVWGERSDVATFYSCMDAVIFPSRGEYGDMETNPLVIREALAWDIPLFVRDRSFYMGMYSESSNVKFMSDSGMTNAAILSRLLDVKIEQIDEKKMQNKPIDKDFFKKRLFEISFEQETNKVNFKYLEHTALETTVCVRDIDTEVPIYTFDATFDSGSEIWCIPIPKQYYDFGGNPNFGGFMYDFYVNGERRYTSTTRLKATEIQKDKFRVESFEPIFVNYEQFFTDRIYDPFIMKARQHHSLQVLPGNIGTVVDIGANVGLFTELALRNGAEKIVAVEISEKANEVFRNIHGDNKNVSLVEKAISSKRGEITVYTDPNNSLVGSVLEKGYGESTTVECISLDDLISECSLESIDLLKIDVEGSEYAIFDGASDESLSIVENMIVEFHSNYGGILSESILRRLDDLFEYQILQDDCKSRASEWEESGTIFARRKR